MDPRGMVGRIYKEEHYTLLQSSGPCDSEKKIFLCFSHDAPETGPYGPQGHGWQDL